MQNNDTEEQGFQFPCAYQVKAMGLHDDEFELLVVELISRHCEHIHEGSVSSRPSKNGKYVSVSVTIQAQSRKQLDAVYDELTAHDKILMRL
ncbi:MAG: YbeD family protein [bacterium]